VNRTNPLLEPVAVQAEAAILTNPASGVQVLALTIRHPAGETTVFLSREQAVTWRDLMDVKISAMTTLTLPGQIPPPPPGQPGPLPFDSFPTAEGYRHPNGGGH
jgi:hypothetical protein